MQDWCCEVSQLLQSVFYMLCLGFQGALSSIMWRLFALIFHCMVLRIARDYNCSPFMAWSMGVNNLHVVYHSDDILPAIPSPKKNLSVLGNLLACLSFFMVGSC